MKKHISAILAFCGILFASQTFGQTASMTISSNDGCPLDTFTLTNTTDFSGGGTCTLVSQPDNQTTSGCQASYTWSYDTPGSYNITYTYTAPGGSPSVWQSGTITIHQPAPVPNLVLDIANGTTICTNCIVDPVAYQISWYVDGELVDVDVDEYFEIVYGLPVTVTVTNLMGGCVGTTTQTFTGINDITATPLRLFPNPASQQIRVIAPNTNSTYEIRDVVGQLVETGQITTPDFTLNVTSFVNGIYTLGLHSGSNMQTARFIVLH